MKNYFEVFFYTQNILPKEFNKIKTGKYIPIPACKGFQESLINVRKSKAIPGEDGETWRSLQKLEYVVEYTNIIDSLETFLVTFTIPEDTRGSYRREIKQISSIQDIKRVVDMYWQRDVIANDVVTSFPKPLEGAYLNTYLLTQESKENLDVILNTPLSSRIFTRHSPEYYTVKKTLIKNILLMIPEEVSFEYTIQDSITRNRKELVIEEYIPKLEVSFKNVCGSLSFEKKQFLQIEIERNLLPRVIEKYNTGIIAKIYHNSKNIAPDTLGNFTFHFHASKNMDIDYQHSEIYTNASYIDNFNLLPTQEKENIIYSPEGIAVGEFIDKNLYCFLPEFYTKDIKKFIHQASILLSMSIEERKSFYSKIELSWDRKARANFIQGLGEARIEYHESLSQKFTELEGTVRFQEEGYIKALQILDNHSHVLKAFKSISKEGIEKESLSLINALENHVRVKKLIFKQNTLSILTDTMYIEDPRTELLHEIGEFDISFPILMEHMDVSDITVTNLTRKAFGTGHPHVGSTGKPCFGNIQRTMAKLLGTRNYEVMLELIVQFLESIVTNDEWGGARIQHYPVVREKGSTEYFSSTIFNELEERYVGASWGTGYGIEEDIDDEEEETA